MTQLSSTTRAVLSKLKADYQSTNWFLRWLFASKMTHLLNAHDNNPSIESATAIFKACCNLSIVERWLFPCFSWFAKSYSNEDLEDKMLETFQLIAEHENSALIIDARSILSPTGLWTAAYITRIKEHANPVALAKALVLLQEANFYEHHHKTQLETILENLYLNALQNHREPLDVAKALILLHGAGLLSSHLCAHIISEEETRKTVMLIGNSVDPLTTAIQLVEFQALEHAGIANDQAIFCQNFLQKHCRQKELKPTTSALIKLHNLGLDKELMFIVKHMEHHNDYIQPIYLTTVLLIMQKLGYPIAKLTEKMLSAEWQNAYKESSPFSSIFCDTLRIVYESGILNSHNAEIYINALIDIRMTTWNEACNLNNFKENGELTVEKFEQYILSKLPTNAGATPNALSSKNNPEPSTFEATFFAAARRGLLPIAEGGMTLKP